MFDFAAFFEEYGELLWQGTVDTLLMVTIAAIVAYVVGIPLAVICKITEPGGLRPIPLLNAVLGWIINMGRSIPYIILMVLLIPLSRAIVGTSLGVPGALVPLAIAAAPFVARLVENSFSEIHPGRIEAAQAFGASNLQIIYKVFLKESLPSLVRGAAISYITLIAYSTIAGALGAGGLGDIAIRFGYHRYQDDLMFATLIILIIMVQVVQSVSDLIARKIDKR